MITEYKRLRDLHLLNRVIAADDDLDLVKVGSH